MSVVYSEAIDTSVSGLIVFAQHNLNSFPFISFLQEDLVGKLTAISIFDPVFVEIEYVDLNQVKITFSGPFKGHFRALTGNTTDLQQDILDVKEDINFLYERLNAFATNSKFDQINSLRDAQHSDLDTRLNTLSTDLTTLKNRVDNL